MFVDQEERPVEIEKLSGVIEFSLEPGKHRIQVRFTDTPVREWSERISLLALFLLLMTPWIVRGFRFNRFVLSRNPTLHPG